MFAVLDVETIKSSGLCSGCGLCAGIEAGDTPAIEMRDSPEGYRRPYTVRDVSDEHARLINEVCPGANIAHDPALFEGAYDPVWGPLIEKRLGWSSDPALRHQASSGGALSAILLHALDRGDIDYVVQTSVSDNSPLRNALAISTGRGDVLQAAGSRYAPSSPLEDIGERLDAPGRFAFVGKPCDVAGLRRLARSDPRVDQKVAFMVAFMCAGVPSYRGTSAVLDGMGVEHEKDVASFRYRGNGWPGHATAELKSGEEFTMDYVTSWGAVLNRHLQFRCKICPDGIGEFADFVSADGWHCDDQGRALLEESEGRSIVLTRTRKGEALVAGAIASGDLITEQVTTREIAQMQPFQAKRKGMVLPRFAAMAMAGRKRPNYQNMQLLKNTRNLGVKEALRSFAGTLRRLLKGQGRE